MDQVNTSLLQSIQTGFIDKSILSNNKYRPELLINDSKSGKKILSTIDWELRNCNEFWISVAFVTTSGVSTIINALIELHRKGIKGKILVSQYLNFTQPEALSRLLQFENIELRIAVDSNFHSKGYLFKNDKLHDLIIGSSNLTASALCVNKEWNLKVTATLESQIIFNSLAVFQNEFDKASIVNDEFISEYKIIYNKQREFSVQQTEILETSLGKRVTPNEMQLGALINLEKIRSEGKKKALLISATGTGKTYLSAFDVLKYNPGRFLFVVHRANIAGAAMRTFEAVFGRTKSMGFYTGNKREKDNDFIFSTIQTISKNEHLSEFSPEHFDYIVIDESHRAGADSYRKIVEYFNPKFLLGMTATPERTDGFDIFKMFDHTIAYEIRLHKAMEEDMLSPFHYFGITDITVNGEVLDNDSDFSKLTSGERVDRVIEKIKLYGCDNGIVRGLIFCSRQEECIELSKFFNERGFKTIALMGNNSEEERVEAINRLESDSIREKLDYIFTVDIFNEGVDIPSVNQIVLLRPTKSAIVFVQQLGRGLRKVKNKEYLTVIDFIGNYSNNYMVPIALYGDMSYNKDTLRKLISSGSSLIPGTSTINFDELSMRKIFESIDSAKLDRLADLKKDYQLLKFKLGRIPMMVDFLEHGSRDPQLYVKNKTLKSYFNFVQSQEVTCQNRLNSQELKFLEYFANEINNAKRVEESYLMKLLFIEGSIDFELFKKSILTTYGYEVTDETILSCINNLNFKFVRKPQEVLILNNQEIVFSPLFSALLQNKLFYEFLLDNIEYSIISFNKQFERSKFINGFILYEKYSRKDVCRILNWEFNEEATVYGYKLNNNSCPIFVNYHKEENIASSTKFPEKFLSPSEFLWYSKPQRRLTNSTLLSIRNHNNKLRLPLFMKKHNGEGADFYYMGDVKPIESSFEETTIRNDSGGNVPVVKVILELKNQVENSMFNYLTAENKNEINLHNQHTAEQIGNENFKSIKIIPFEHVKPFINSVPFYDISVAAGYFSEQHELSDVQWVELPPQFKPSVDYFVCKVVGESMNKRIPNGSYCLFKKDSGGTREDKIVLVEHYSIQDPDFGSGYTVKQYNSSKEITNETWRHKTIKLSPISHNKDFEAIVLEDNELSGLKVIGLFMGVLA